MNPCPDGISSADLYKDLAKLLDQPSKSPNLPVSLDLHFVDELITALREVSFPRLHLLYAEMTASKASACW